MHAIAADFVVCRAQCGLIHPHMLRRHHLSLDFIERLEMGLGVDSHRVLVLSDSHHLLLFRMHHLFGNRWAQLAVVLG